MTQCAATAELIDGNMQIIPGVILRCELSEGHRLECERCRWEDGFGAREPVGHDHPLGHLFTLRWHDITTAELAEVLDPDEEFDLEVDIAPAEVIEHQVVEPEPAAPVGREQMFDSPTYSTPRPTLDPIPDAAPRCLVCGREVVELVVGLAHRYPLDVPKGDYHDAEL